MKIRRFFIVLIVCVSCITFFSVSVSAAEIDGFYSKDMSVSASGVNADTTEDITNSVSVSSGTYSNKACTVYSLPLNSDYVYRICSAYHIDSLNSGHEYNIKFSWQSGIPSSTNFHLRLVYYDSEGNELRVQDLYTVYSSASHTGWQDVDIDFTPDASGLSGYKARIEFSFLYQSSSLVNLRLSEIIELTDKEDNSDLLQSILTAILTLDSNIDSYISDLETSLISQLITLDSNIDSYFDELGGELVSAITTLDSHIDGYFQLLKDGIIENDNALSDKLHEYLDKYKPRFYETFEWVRGNIDSTTGDSYVTNDYNAVISDLFLVNDVPYYLEYKGTLGAFDSCYVYVYDLNRTYLRWYKCTPNTVYELEPGYYYRFRLKSSSSLSSSYGEHLSEYCNEVVLVYSDEGWLTSFGRYIVREFNQILNPGVYEDPGEDEFQQNKDEFEQIESELPTFDSSDMEEVDISNYSGGFGAVRYLFDRFINVSGLETLLAFSLMFGLGVFLIGRKVGG